MLAILRGLHLAALLSALGSAGFLLWVIPAADEPRPVAPTVFALCRASLGLALVLGAAWFTLLAGAIADAHSVATILPAMPLVALHTWVGHAVLARFILLFIAVLLAITAGTRPPHQWPARPILAVIAIAAALALGTQGMIGHAGASGSLGLVLSEWLHLLAAGVWLGGLLPLWLAIGRLIPTDAACLCERFSPVALGCVLVLGATGIAQALALIGSFQALVGTTYGRIALVKTSLFLLALVLAASNRLWLTDRLAAGGRHARAALRVSVIAETLLGLAIVVAAACLASAEPGIDRPAPSSVSWAHRIAWPLSADDRALVPTQDGHAPADGTGPVILVSPNRGRWS